ncbi:eaa protein, partial [Klebsiella pneumoniae]
MERLLNAGNSPVIPDGYVMVPKEATLEMIKSGASAASNGMLIPGIYKAMLAAAPQEVTNGK